MTTLSELVSEVNPKKSRLSVLLKGDAGSGKTRTALSFPEPILLLYTDTNRETVREQIVEREADVTLIQVAKFSDLENRILPLITARKLEDELGKPIQTIVLDSVSNAGNLLEKEILGSRDALVQRDWGTIKRRLSSVMRALSICTHDNKQHPGYHVVLTSHLRDVTDDGGNLQKVRCHLPGAYKDEIDRDVDYSLLLEEKTLSEVVGGKVKEERQFIIHSSAPDRYHICKGGKLPPKLIVPEGANAFEMLNQTWGVSPTTEGVSETPKENA